MSKRWQNNRNDAGSLLASTFVVALGSGCVVFLVVALSADFSPFFLGLMGLIATALFATIILQRLGRGRTGSMSFWSMFGQSHREDGLACNYRPRKIRGRADVDAEVPRPIHAEEVRQIQETSSSTWVPSRGKNGGRA